MRYCTLEYRHSDNIGDEIQSLAAEQYLPRVDAFIDRDTGLQDVSEPSFVFMNGWFKHGPTHWRDGATECWPPAPALRPGFVGFHIAYPELLTDAFLEYCQQWQPIGCRDLGTLRLLEAKGITAYFSRCLTLTFPRRSAQPAEGKVYVVDGQKRLDLEVLPAALRREAVRRNHYVAPHVKPMTPRKREIARRLLDEYRSSARLIVTNLLHCAMPCIAMGIPVVFMSEPDPLYPDDYRLDPIKDLLPIHRTSDPVDWEPPVVDVSALKTTIQAAAQALIP